jgi:hypothetical protein
MAGKAECYRSEAARAKEMTERELDPDRKQQRFP